MVSLNASEYYQKQYYCALSMSKAEKVSVKKNQTKIDSLSKLRNSKWFKENRTRTGLLLKPVYKSVKDSNRPQTRSLSNESQHTDQNSNKLSVILDVEQSQMENKSLINEDSSKMFPQKSVISKYLNGLKIQSISLEPSIQIVSSCEKNKAKSAQKTKRYSVKDLISNQERQAASLTSVISIMSDQLQRETKSKQKPENQNKIQNQNNMPDTTLLVKPLEKKKRGRKSKIQRQALQNKTKITQQFDKFQIKIQQINKKEKMIEKRIQKEPTKQQTKQATHQTPQKDGVIVLDDEKIYDSICKEVQIEVFDSYQSLCQNSLRVLQLTKRNDKNKQKFEEFIKEEFRKSLNNAIRISIGETATKCQASIAEIMQTLGKKEYE